MDLFVPDFTVMFTLSHRFDWTGKIVSQFGRQVNSRTSDEFSVKSRTIATS